MRVGPMVPPLDVQILTIAHVNFEGLRAKDIRHGRRLPQNLEVAWHDSGKNHWCTPVVRKWACQLNSYIPISSHTSMPTAFAASFKRLKTTFAPFAGKGAGQQPHNEQSLRAKHNVVRCNTHQTLNTIAALFQATFNAKQPCITSKLQSHLSPLPKNLQKNAVCHCSPLYSLVIRHCISCSMTGLVGHSRGVWMDHRTEKNLQAVHRLWWQNMESDDWWKKGKVKLIIFLIGRWFLNSFQTWQGKNLTAYTIWIVPQLHGSLWWEPHEVSPFQA